MQHRALTSILILSFLAWDLEALSLPMQPISINASSQQKFSLQEQADQLLDAAIQLQQQGEYDSALEYFQEALTIYQASSDRAGEAYVLTLLGILYRQIGEFDAALSYYAQALTLQEESGDRRGEGITLNNIAIVYNNLGRFDTSISYLESALVVSQSLGNRSLEASIYNNLGDAYRNLGDYDNALNYLQDALSINQFLSNPSRRGIILNNLGQVAEAQGDNNRALHYYQEALEIFQDIGDTYEEGTTLNNIGVIYYYLGQYGVSLDYFERAHMLRQQIGDRPGEASTLNNIGKVYDLLGQYEQALDYYQSSLALFQSMGDRLGESILLNNIGLIYVSLDQNEEALGDYDRSLMLSQTIGDQRGESITLNNIGEVYRHLDDDEIALSYYQDALEISQTIGDRKGEGMALSNIGLIYDGRGEYERAFRYYYSALTYYQLNGDRREIAIVFGNLGFLFESLNQPELAISFFKQSVSHWEDIRNDVQALSFETQQSLTESVSETYRHLADLLLQSDRVFEAREILDLLKIQELEEYHLQPTTPISELSRIDFWGAERNILGLFQANLERQIDTDLQIFLNNSNIVASVNELQRTARGQNLNPEQLIRLQDNLDNIGQVALLYPLILDDRIELILVTPFTIERKSIRVERDTFSQVLSDFRAKITDRRSNPLPEAQQLYQWLIEPIEETLSQDEINTLLYAADGALRYVPLTALHDGEQWLTQQFTINHITAASLTDFSHQASSPPRILAGAFPSTGLNVDLETEQVWYSGLPFAQVEVESVKALFPNTVVLIGNAFNRAAIEQQLGQYSILHFATHAEFQSGHPTDSYIVLGNGDRITLSDLSDWHLPNVALVVLSACRTAVNHLNLDNGEAILGFGYQVQRTGAQAAIASLWYVDDNSTQVLMSEFYTQLRSGHTTAQSLQLAQIHLLESAEREFNHPYAWAAFILIGNGL
jgi:CHAT domain-containing protein/Tfp pilus assembly protein PilF